MELVKDSQKTLPVICRSTQKTSLKGFYFESWNILKKQLNVTNLAEKCVFSDLTLGAWKGHWIVHELSNQLNIKPYSHVQPLIGIDNEQQEYADTINRIIDNESTGDQNFIIAHNSCKKIITELIRQNIEWVVIICPLENYSWEKENIQFIELLAEGLKTTSCNIALLNDDNTSISENWNVVYDFQKGNNIVSKENFPIAGIISSELSCAFRELLPKTSLVLLNNSLVIPPSERKTKIVNPVFFINILRKIEHASHLRVCFEIEEVTNSANIEFLQHEASKRFSEGGYSIALRILEAIRTKISDEIILASVVSQIQNIRIALMYFSDAANEMSPSKSLPVAYQTSLYMSKAWGLVMTNKAKEAEPLFKFARTYLSKEKFPRVYLYLLNISALNKLKIGEIEAAFALEKEIEHKLAQQKHIDWHILYINSINQARLYKKIKNYELARKYYLIAFNINNSLKIESDLLYFNFCFAQLETLKGNHKIAFMFLLRACIHWLSNESPEALAPRVAQAILRKNLSSESSHVEEISEQLTIMLHESASKIKLSLKPNTSATKNIVFSDIIRASGKAEIAIGTEGMGVLVSNNEDKSVYSGKYYNGLKNVTYNALCKLLPDLKMYNTIYTDSQFGNELPVSSKELVSSCLRHGILKIIFKEKKYVFTKDEQCQTYVSSKVKICSAISFVNYKGDNAVVYFKRYKKPIILTKTEQAILVKVPEYSNVKSVLDDFNNDAAILQTLKTMEQQRLITIYL